MGKVFYVFFVIVGVCNSEIFLTSYFLIPYNIVKVM